MGAIRHFSRRAASRALSQNHPGTITSATTTAIATGHATAARMGNSTFSLKPISRFHISHLPVAEGRSFPRGPQAGLWPTVKENDDGH